MIPGARERDLPDEPEQPGTAEIGLDPEIDFVYDHLRRVARAYLTPASQTLQPTALVHEAYLKLTSRDAGSFRDREHFVCTAAKAMRHVLVDYARAKRSQKRGKGWARVTLTGIAGDGTGEFDAADVSDALRTLEQLSPRQGLIVELRFFGGLSTEQIAQRIGVSERTVQVEWRFARAWLRAALAEGLEDDEAPPS